MGAAAHAGRLVVLVRSPLVICVMQAIQSGAAATPPRAPPGTAGSPQGARQVPCGGSSGARETAAQQQRAACQRCVRRRRRPPGRCPPARAPLGAARRRARHRATSGRVGHAPWAQRALPRGQISACAPRAPRAGRVVNVWPAAACRERARLRAIRARRGAAPAPARPPWATIGGFEAPGARKGTVAPRGAPRRRPAPRARLLATLEQACRCLPPTPRRAFSGPSPRARAVAAVCVCSCPPSASGARCLAVRPRAGEVL